MRIVARHRLGPEDAVAVGMLRREALTTEPLAFGSTLDTQRDYGAFYARILTEEAEQQAIFGAFFLSVLGLSEHAHLRLREPAQGAGDRR